MAVWEWNSAVGMECVYELASSFYVRGWGEGGGV